MSERAQCPPPADGAFEAVIGLEIHVQLSTATYEAYNSWGGASLYKRIGVRFPHGTADRSRAVTFDRPYEWPGAGQIFDFEYPLIYWLESQGEDVA